MSETQVIVGCCGWAEAQARYFSHFPVIEIQSTFYQPPDLAVAERWKLRAPLGFRFNLKAWQLITHPPSSPTYRRLKHAISREEQELYGSFRPTEQVWLAWERTREIARTVDARVIVFQCPKSFLPTRENVRNLSRFFHAVDRDARILGWEPRGDEWKPELIADLCADCNLIHIVDPFQSDPAHAHGIYWRLHGRMGYRYRYTDEDLAELETTLSARAHLPGPKYVLFNNVYSREDALRFIQLQDPSGWVPAA